MTTILQVIDTRERNYLTGDGKAIPGTGDKRPCDCCGKDHEVHVYISGPSGRQIVGTSCVKAMRKTGQVISSPRRLDGIRLRDGGYASCNLIKV